MARMSEPPRLDHRPGSQTAVAAMWRRYRRSLQWWRGAPDWSPSDIYWRLFAWKRRISRNPCHDALAADV